MLQIFGWGSHRLILTAELDWRAVAAGKDCCRRTDVCCIYLFGVHIGLGYSGQDQRQLRALILPIRVLGRTFLVTM